MQQVVEREIRFTVGRARPRRTGNLADRLTLQLHGFPPGRASAGMACRCGSRALEMSKAMGRSAIHGVEIGPLTAKEALPYSADTPRLPNVHPPRVDRKQPTRASGVPCRQQKWGILRPLVPFSMAV